LSYLDTLLPLPLSILAKPRPESSESLPLSSSILEYTTSEEDDTDKAAARADTTKDDTSKEDTTRYLPLITRRLLRSAILGLDNSLDSSLALVSSI
jgi:hypothetical protein